MIKTTLPLLNNCNGADDVLHEYIQKVADTFENPNVVLMGIAYGGDAENAGKILKGKGTVYAYDTFEDKHPIHLAIRENDREATCMDHWYDKNIFGTDGLSHEYQSRILEGMGLTNVHLIKGEVNKDSCKEIDKIHLAFLDMDILVSMKNGYEAIVGRLVKDGYLALHDVVTEGNLPLLKHWYETEIKPNYKVLYESEGTHLAVLQNVGKL